jgi:putative transposase
LPISNEFKRQHPRLNSILIPFPHRLKKEFLREVRINPKHNGQYFEIEFVCEIEVQPAQYLPEKALSIDLGLENLAACLDTTGASFIIDGQALKTINQWYNKENARLQSIKDKQKVEQLTNRQFRLLNYRNNYLRDYLNKAARHIINYCVVEGIGKLIVGCN